MDNKQKVVAVAVVVSVIVGIGIISILLINRDTYRSCQLLGEKPTSNSSSVLASKDNSCLVRFSGFVEYPINMRSDRSVSDSNFVELKPREITFFSAADDSLEIEADCGKLTMKMQRNATSNWVTSFNLQAFDGGKGKQCDLWPGSTKKFFVVPSTGHYKCDQLITYVCDPNKVDSPRIQVTAFEFECKRNTTSTGFVSPPETCKFS